MNRVTKVILAVSLTVIVGSFGFIGGFATSRMLPSDAFSHLPGVASSPTGSVPVRVDEVGLLLQRYALVPPTEASATAGAIQGLLTSMGDKYATYYDKTQYDSFTQKSEGSFGGVGVLLGEKNGTCYVVRVTKDAPALEAGIKAGDVFRVIAGVRRDKWLSADVVERVRGAVGTPVTVTMFRPQKTGATTGPGVETTYTLKRATIDFPNTISSMIGKVGYMRIAQFNGNSEKEIRKAVTDLTKKGATSLVLDLRDNPGGLLSEAVDVSSLFIQDGAIVRVDERNKPEQVLLAKNDKMTDLPLVVLIDANSASASEITAGALQDYGRATLVGVTSYGKGSVQTARQVSWGGAVKFTIAHYLTPKRQVIDGKGLKPDVVVKMDPLKQMKRSTDTQLQRALQIASSKAAAGN